MEKPEKKSLIACRNKSYISELNSHFQLSCMKSSNGVWKNQASQWQRVGPPLRPSRPDHTLLENVIQKWHSKNGSPRVLVLGVTPEMARLNWPAGTDLLAVDHSQRMIDEVWPGYPSPGEGVLCANWLDLALKKHSRNIVVSDGPFGVLRYPFEYQKLLQSLRDILQPEGFFAFRIFTSPEIKEEPKDIFDAVLSGNIGNFHVFKLRLLMAMQPDSSSGVRIGDVWDEWVENGPQAEALSKQCGWPIEQIQTIEAYKGQKDIYCFPTLKEILEILDTGGFKIVSCTHPTYELGERCPTLVCKP